MRALGHDLSMKYFPAGGGLRDVAHAKLITRFLALISQAIPRRLEVPVGGAGDLRAWDIVLHIGHIRIGVAAETRLRDFQALLRREQLKQRESGVDRLLFVVLASHGNRRTVAEAGPALREALPLDGRAVWPALKNSRDPGGNGLIFL
jgi:hypothetical protein